MDWAAIFLTLVGAVIGTALSFYAPALLERRQYKRRKEFFGTWFSAYQSLDYQAEWVDEKVIIDLDMNQFRIRNTSNEADYDYIAHGELVEGTYLHGRYVSNRPGSNAFGAFVLLNPYPQAKPPDFQPGILNYSWNMS